MQTEDIIKIIEELDEIQLNKVIIAACRTYNCRKQENELGLVALPKNNPEKRKQVIQWFCKMAEENMMTE